MTSPTRLVTLAAAALFLAGLGSRATAQSATAGGQGSKMYDVKTETTVTGTVESAWEVLTWCSRPKKTLLEFT
jgi:hypothetical protein